VLDALRAADPTNQRASSASPPHSAPCRTGTVTHSFINRPSSRGSNLDPLPEATSSSTRPLGSLTTSSSRRSIAKIFVPTLRPGVKPNPVPWFTSGSRRNRRRRASNRRSAPLGPLVRLPALSATHIILTRGGDSQLPPGEEWANLVKRREAEMRKLVVQEWMSLDGVVQAPGAPDEDTSGGFAHGAWSLPYFDQAAQEWVMRHLSDAGGFLLGRRTFEVFASYWPNASEEEQVIAEPMNTKPKDVASTTLTGPLEWENSTVLEGEVDQAVAAVKPEGGG